MSITVPDTCILAESNQLIEYLSPSNSQTETLKQKPNGLVLFVMQHKLAGHFLWEWPVKQKNVHFAGLAPPTSARWSSLDVHCLQMASMYTKKPKEMGSQLMICGQVYCVNTHLSSVLLIVGFGDKLYHDYCLQLESHALSYALVLLTERNGTRAGYVACFSLDT